MTQERWRARTVVHRSVTNLPIRVPGTDWPAIVTGHKLMFRTYNRSLRDRFAPVVPEDMECPRPCLLFARRGRGELKRVEAVPGVLLSHRQEPLGTITPEDLQAELCESLAQFRHYWKMRYPALGWRPWDMVSVIEVRPMCQGDYDTLGHWALRQLYGDWAESL